VTAAVPDSQKQRGQTAYRVLKFPDSRVSQPGGTTTSSSMSDGLKDVGVIRAATKTAAIRAASDKNGAGVYVAVTDKSWRPQKVTVEQTSVVKVGDA
jgi:hypothetical protein